MALVRPLEVALGTITRVGRAYQFSPGAQAQITDALDHWCKQDSDEVKDAGIDELVALAVVLERQHRQPELAELLRRAVFASPDALLRIEASCGPAGLTGSEGPEAEDDLDAADADDRAQLSSRLGLEKSKRAPQFGEKSPEGGMLLRDFLEPGRRPRAGSQTKSQNKSQKR